MNNQSNDILLKGIVGEMTGTKIAAKHKECHGAEITFKMVDVDNFNEHMYFAETVKLLEACQKDITRSLCEGIIWIKSLDTTTVNVSEWPSWLSS